MWKNLLPQGTRTIELYSGLALFTTAWLILASILHIPVEFIALDSDMPWGVVLLIFGALQVLSIYQYPKLEVLRTCISWLVGCIWIWLAVAGPSDQFHIEDVAVLFLGLGNLYGFILSFNLLHIQWTE